jgi:hypothetical protein
MTFSVEACSEVKSPNDWLFFYFKSERQFMAFPATHVRLSHGAFALFAIRADLHPSLKKREGGTGDSRPQLHVFAGVGAGNIGHRAGLAKVGRPALSAGFQQAAFLHVATAIIVAVEVWTFTSCGGSHGVEEVGR